ncbi:MAG: HAMP domain-containing histidine kinase [Oscillospiraceae bacterium]|nr:HAMP domain-containing histidine kinase [Oscillospiraceae bacterium]
MFKSIFSKYFTVVAIAILASFLALCGTQLFLSTRYWVTEKRDALFDSADTFGRYIAAYTVRVGGGVALREDFLRLLPLMTDFSTATDSVILARADGKVVFSSDPHCSVAHGMLPESLLALLREQQEQGEGYFEIGTLEGIFAGRQYTAALPVYTDYGYLYGYVFASAGTSTLTRYLANNLQVFLLAALGVLALTFIAVYVMTYRLVWPLRQMASATRCFSEGDFSVRIPVKGRDEVAQLAFALNSMAISLSSLEDMRRSFVTNVSHELKTPMTTIAGFVDGILDGTIAADKRNHYLKIVSNEVKRLSRLVKTMLDLSRIDSGQLRLTPVRFDLREAVCNCLLPFERRIEEGSIRVTGLENCPRAEITADYDLIGQVVYNLLDNAVKFTNHGGEIRIGLENRDNRVYFRVRNTGAGIPAREMPRIFDRFYKSDKSRGLDKNGVGLGLYIVRTVINLHEGEIAVFSAEGEFCEFEFWLPAPSPIRMGAAFIRMT